MGAIFSGLASFSFGCDMLHSNPSLFTSGFFVEGSGPTDADLEGASFCTYTTGYGSQTTTNKEDDTNNEEEEIQQVVKVTCKGPEPGYIATPRMLVALALTVLNHREELAFSGGVMLPGALFGKTTEVYDILKGNGISFEVVTEDN